MNQSIELIITLIRSCPPLLGADFYTHGKNYQQIHYQSITIPEGDHKIDWERLPDAASVLEAGFFSISIVSKSLQTKFWILNLFSRFNPPLSGFTDAA